MWCTRWVRPLTLCDGSPARPLTWSCSTWGCPAGARGVPPGVVGGGMATAIHRRGPDDRRTPVLAAPQAGGERSAPDVPAHRAGRRGQVRAAGLRRTLALVSIAVTAMVAFA